MRFITNSNEKVDTKDNPRSLGREAKYDVTGQKISWGKQNVQEGAVRGLIYMPCHMIVLEPLEHNL